MDKYRFALAYENTVDRGWITSHIFDVMRSGGVPVYLGAPDITDWVPSDCFFRRQEFTSDRDLGDYLKDAGESEYGRYQEAIRDYLGSARFRAFSAGDLAERFADAFGCIS
jgi:hypothetical protein